MTPSEDAPLVDARGTRCPVPVIRVARAVRDLQVGAAVVLLADDVAARSDILAWGRLRGHVVEVGEVDPQGVTVYRVVVGAGGTAGTGQDEKST